jgi:hypothetical protein
MPVTNKPKAKKAAKRAAPSKTNTKHYVKFFFPNVFVDDSETKQVETRETSSLKLPQFCHAFSFFDRVETSSGGEVLKGKPKNFSGMYYVDGEAWTLEQVRSKLPEERILIANMEGNKWGKVIRTRNGGFRPFEKGDQTFRTKKKP